MLWLSGAMNDRPHSKVRLLQLLILCLVVVLDPDYWNQVCVIAGSIRLELDFTVGTPWSVRVPRHAKTLAGTFPSSWLESLKLNATTRRLQDCPVNQMGIPRKCWRFAANML